MDEVLEYFNRDELAASVWKNKYAAKGETSPDQMHRRLAKEFARKEHEYIVAEEQLLKDTPDAKDKLSSYGKSRCDLTEDSIYELFKGFKYVVPQGSVMSQLGAKSIGSLSNCFIIDSPIDSYGGIMKTDQEQVQLMKRRGGVGFDISTLRPSGAPTSNAAKSSTGAVSFMHRFSNSTREVAQSGRRGALMLSINVSHPDIFEFVKIKRDLDKVTGANISVKLNNGFMDAVKNNSDYVLRWPTDANIGKSRIFDYPITLKEVYKNVYVRRIRAKELWGEIIKSAHASAEPGLMFWDQMINYSPDGVYSEYRQISTNPCGEIPTQPNDSCRLMVNNLYSYVIKPFTEDAVFDFDLFYENQYEAMRLADDLVDLEVEHINRIINKIESDPENIEIKGVELNLWKKIKRTALASRRTGLGVTGLGDMLAAMNLKYDSDDASKLVDEVFKIKMLSELDCTTDMAILRGAFNGNSPSIEFDMSYLAEDGTPIIGNNTFYTMLLHNYRAQAKRMIAYGRRNVSWSTIAPTGSVSILTQTTSGIEPLFQPYYIRRKKINPSDGGRIDFTDQNGDTWQEYPVLHPKFKEWILDNWVDIIELLNYDVRSYNIDGLTNRDLSLVFEKSPWYGSTANDIDWERRVELQGLIQSYITHSISSTINLPNNVTEEEVGNIYMKAYEHGLKGITIYREGSRSGVLVTTGDNVSFEQKDAVKRPKSLKADAYTVTALGEKFNVIVGLLDDHPYEVFAFPYEADIDGNGVVVKLARGKYEYTDSGGEVLKGLTRLMTDEQAALSRMISTALRHGTHIKYVVDQLNKSNGTIVSFSKAIARTLKRYVAKPMVGKCGSCGGALVHEDGCVICKSCGESKCN